MFLENILYQTERLRGYEISGKLLPRAFAFPYLDAGTEFAYVTCKDVGGLASIALLHGPHKLNELLNGASNVKILDGLMVRDTSRRLRIQFAAGKTTPRE